MRELRLSHFSKLLVGSVLIFPALFASAKAPQDALIAKLVCPDRVTDVAFSPDGSLLATAYGWNKEGGVKIWHVADRSVVASLIVGTGEHADVRRVAFSPDGRLFAAANWDGNVMLWTVGSWNAYKTVLAHRGSPTSLSFAPDNSKLAFASEDRLDIYDLRSAHLTQLARQVSKNIGGSFGGSSFSADGSLLAACRPNSIQFWNTVSGKLDKTWKSEWEGFFCQFSQDGNYLIAGGGGIRGEKSVVIWNSASGERMREMSDFRSSVFSATTSRSGTILALAGGGYGEGGDLSLWTIKDGRQIGYLSFGEFPIQGIAFSPDDRVLAAGSEDGYAALFDVDRIRGVQVKEQSSPLCGEVMIEGAQAFLVPLSKVPAPMMNEFSYAWKLQVADGENNFSRFAGYPVVLSSWAIESDASTDRAQVHKFQLLVAEAKSAKALSSYAIFGDIENPGWNKGLVAKVYGDGSFVAATNLGACLAYGSLTKLDTAADFPSLKARLIGEGLLSIPRLPITLGLDHYRTRFIELSVEGKAELRSDGEVVDFSKVSKYPTQKQKDFRRIFESEGTFLTSLLHAGMAPVTQ